MENCHIEEPDHDPYDYDDRDEPEAEPEICRECDRPFDPEKLSELLLELEVCSEACGVKTASQLMHAMRFGVRLPSPPLWAGPVLEPVDDSPIVLPARTEAAA